MNKLLTALSIAAIYVCSASCGLSAQKNNTPPAKAPEADEQIVMGVLYQQRAAEYRALCFQSYNTAMRTIDDAVKTKKKQEMLAVVTDLDETALDNSGFEVRQIKAGETYASAAWHKWCQDAVADSVPGSVSFFNYADKKGVQIFYISNRDTTELLATIANMKKLGFPQLTPDHFMMHTDTSSKDARRKEVEKKYTIAALLGDNLIDLHSCFDNTSMAVRLHRTDSMKSAWGKKYIVLPNAIYGDWENALYRDYQSTHPGTFPTLHVKDSLRDASMVNP